MQHQRPNRIAELREKHGISQGELARQIGTGRSQVVKLERGERRLTQDWMEKIGAVLREPPAALLLSRTDHSIATDGVNGGRHSDYKKAGLMEIDELDVHAHAGAGALVAKESVLRRWQVADGAVIANDGDPSEVLKILEIRGDSMEPTLFDGQKVVVDTSDLTPSPPGLFVVWDGLGVVAKRIELVPNSEPLTVRLISDNQHYSPYERAIGEAHIRGRIKAWWRRT